MTTRTKTTAPHPPPPASARRSFRGVTHEDRQLQRRQQLIEAGITAFGEHGYHAVTVREICAGARLTERYFYESFSGLEDLFVSVYRTINESLMQATLLALESSPADAEVLAERSLRVFLKFVRADPQRARIFLIDAISISYDVQRISAGVAGDYAGLIRRFIAQLFPEASRGGLDLDLIATGLIGSNVHIATHWLREDFRTPLSRVLVNMLAFYRVLTADLRPAGPPPRRLPAKPPRRS